MTPTDRDALIERVKAFEKALHAKGRTSPNIYLTGGSLTSKDLRALISLASPSPAQTEDEPITYQYQHTDAMSGRPVWMEKRTWNGHTSKVSRPLYLRPALATIPPPEDERVKGLVEGLTTISKFKTGGPHAPGQLKNEHRAMILEARSALASYRGGA